LEQPAERHDQQRRLPQWLEHSMLKFDRHLEV